ncbi:MAG TPA: FAD-dependent oxidoreductase, partial [Candidatus Saccharimonadales bacterium]|nr:FAD-dependent oxidoreductase [Candidatus Saccharimonadales bacterium]
MNQHRTRALVVGGGFGGIKAALELSKGKEYDVTLLSDRPDFYYFPTMYHTATGGRTAQSRIPLARIFKDEAVTITIGSATKLNRKKKIIRTADGKDHAFDLLVVALGSVPNYFGIQGIQEYSYSIRTVEEIRRFKEHLHRQLADELKPDLNYVIVGGGPTGIELAGALPDYLRNIMKTHGIKHRTIHIDLIEAAPHLVPRMPKHMGRKIEQRLRRLGIKLYLGQAVQGLSADALTVNGKPIQSHTVVWTAGVTNHP